MTILMLYAYENTSLNVNFGEKINGISFEKPFSAYLAQARKFLPRIGEKWGALGSVFAQARPIFAKVRGNLTQAKTV